ncbi:MAG TPA: tRNA pseudouridine(38-40) synthase TruA [Chitinophagaceae bacterium]|nr:tRNA pseudouridine(38-40) synthase TruA [Chitinophagaceae bacterium]HNU14380.1 tRNA pseudouridine(38-40) synthase TruA [Chitinophagaceae bacterium]
MPRYFLELAYKGTDYSGFQLQDNANTIQAEVEKAFEILHKQKVILTGSSRTDSGVHAFQNYFHFDYNESINAQFIYKMNAILPEDIVIKKLTPVAGDAHCRFDAVAREYRYYIYRYKNPFLKERAFFFPYRMDIDLMQQAAVVIKEYVDFTSFSKRNTQVKTFNCIIQESKWGMEGDCLVYYVKANRFLRGMVRALTATMLRVGRGKISLNELRDIIEAKDCTKASFAVPPHGLFLISVNYPVSYFS